MLSSPESDPFTTAPAPPRSRSRSDTQALIHGFPQERHSFRNVDRVRQRFIIGRAGGRAGVQEETGSSARKRKLESRNASGSGSGSGLDSAARVSTSTITLVPKGDGVINAETTPDYLKSAQQMESVSVGRTLPSSPIPTTGTDKLHRRRTFAGYQNQNQNLLPHIDLMSKMSRSTPVSPAVVLQKQPVVSKTQQQQQQQQQQQLVLHRLSHRRHRRSLRQSISQTLPNKTLAPLESLTTTITNPDPTSNNGISITQLSAKTLELLIENGLSVVFKKLEVNHGFANETVKRAWLRCNGDIEATDGLLLAMRRAAERAEVVFLSEWDESRMVDDDEEEEEGEEEEERAIKRPRWTEPHISPQSVDSRHMMMDTDYTPPVGTKAEMYRRLTEQGRHDDAQTFLMYSMTPGKGVSTTPGKEGGATTAVSVRTGNGTTNVESRNPSVITHEPIPVPVRMEDPSVVTPTNGGRISKREKHHETKIGQRESIPIPISISKVDHVRTPAQPEPKITRTKNSSITPTNGQRISKRVQHHETTTSKPTDIEPHTSSTLRASARKEKPTSISKPINIESEPPLNQNAKPDDDPSPETPTAEPYTHPSPSNQVRPSSPVSGSDTRQEWTPSDDEALVNAKDKSQMDRLSLKYGEKEVLKRFVTLIKRGG